MGARQTGDDRSEKPIESWDDVRDRLNDLLKRPIDSYRWHERILPRYIDGHLSVHLHLGCSNLGSWCAEIYRDVRGATGNYGHRAPVSDIADRASEVESDCPEMANNQQKRSVLIRVYEVLESRQYRAIGSNVLLRRLDRVDGICGHLSVSKTLKVVSVPLGGVDREGDYLAIIAASPIEAWDKILGGQFPHDVVEGRPSVSYTVSDDGTQSGGRAGSDRKLVLASIGLFFRDDAIRVAVQIDSNLGPERVDVLLSPDDFEPSPIERM
jgi:hypothetical protein